MDVKTDFVARLQRGERMADLCREFGINRQTGYEVWSRFKANGAAGLLARSKAPRRIPHKTPSEIVDRLVLARQEHPTWGAKKLKTVLERDEQLQLPAPSTIQDLLKRKGLIDGRRRRRVFPRVHPTGLRIATSPNEVWCADYKGQFRTGDSAYCYPLTMTDLFSRYLLACDGMKAIDEDAAIESSEHTFRRHGLPDVIRTDNGVPFASVGLAGLTKLAVFWMRLGIDRERIEPGHPEQNGQHERMHRTLKRETTRPAGANLLQQQERFDRFQEEFNNVRPHEALNQETPAKTFQASSRPFPKLLPEPRYPLHDDAVIATSSGAICLPGRRRYYLSAALAGETLGLREEDDGRWTVTFMNLNLGHIDPRMKTFTPEGSKS